jgi:ppGpp synthetase/RelA/SpoT-type nucleotidyltranferase
MNLDEKPPWSKRALRRLGDALVDDRETPEGCPHYDEVILWHNDLAAAVKAALGSTKWAAFDAAEADITARPKTKDTLVQKLRRESHLSLEQVQDLAGVRVDADFTLDVQLALAQEVARYFGDKSVVKDIRESPHSGYRAVHVWLRLAPGRVEIQFRTVAQSAWANTYERLGDLFGRGIRYGVMPDDPQARDLVELLHGISDLIARSEVIEKRTIDRQSWLDGIPESARDAKHDELEVQLSVALRELTGLKTGYIEKLNELKHILDDMEVV